jgi:predicted RNA methylase
MNFFDLLKSLFAKKTAPKDYTELSLFDELDNISKQEVHPGDTKTINRKVYRLSPSQSNPRVHRWQAEDGTEVTTDKETGAVQEQPEPAAVKPAETKPEPATTPDSKKNAEIFELDPDRVIESSSEMETMHNKDLIQHLNSLLSSVQRKINLLKSPPPEMEPRHFAGAVKQIETLLSNIDQKSSSIDKIYRKKAKERNIEDVYDELKSEFEKLKPEAEKAAQERTKEPEPKESAQPKEPQIEDDGAETDLFGNKTYSFGKNRYAVVNKDGKAVLTKIPGKQETPTKEEEPTEGLFSQMQSMLKKTPKDKQTTPEATSTTTPQKKAQEKPEPEEIDLFSQTTKDEVAGEKPEKVQFGAEGLTGGKKKRKEERESLNKSVITILQKPENEITEQDKETLAKYSGRGGTDEVSLNEYYTTSEQAGFIWDCVRQLGFRGGSALEPSCATGVFLHTAPEDTVVTGVELDETSSKIAKILHGDKHEINYSSLEQHIKDSEGEEYDLVIGNCPFGVRGITVMDDPDKIHLNKAEQYFVERGIDKLKEHGIMGMIVPTGIMDNSTWSDWRNDINKQAEFLGSFRMPTGAFHHAHAEVTTDIVFFRKRPAAASNFLVTADAETIAKMKSMGIMDTEFTGGRFFEKNPEYALGEQTTGQYGMKIWKGDFNIEELREKAGLLKPHKDNYDALKEFGIDIQKQEKESPKLGEVKTINGVQYRFNKNHRWERINSQTDGFVLTADEQEIADELGLKPHEFMKLRNNITVDGLHLTDKQREVLEPYRGHKTTAELKGLTNIPLSKLQKCKDAALLGLAIQEYEHLKENGSRDEVWSTAKKLEGKIGEFIEKHGNPADLNKYLDRGRSKGIQTLYGNVDADGVVSTSITDPFNEHTKKDSTLQRKQHNDLTTQHGTVKELFDSGEGVSYYRFKGMYEGNDIQSEEDFTRAMLNNDGIGIDEKGNYAPEKEVFVGTVTDKLETWKQRISEIDTRLQTELNGEQVELLHLEKNKLDKQTQRIRELAGFKEVNDLPIRMGDARTGMFDTQTLNSYFQKQGIELEVTIDPSGKINFVESSFAHLYELYHDKSGLSKEDKKVLDSQLKFYYGENKNPFELAFLNYLNGYANSGKVSSDSKAKMDELEKGFNDFLYNSEEAPEIAERYNSTYNNWVMKDYDEDIIEGIEKLDYDKKLNRYAPDGTQLTIRDSISPNQWGSIRRLVDQGKGMLAHGVGVGKTLQAIVSIAIMKQEGKCKKPLVVTPKSVLLNWGEEAKLWLKDSKVLIVGYRQDKDGKYTIEESNAEKRAKMVEIQRNGHNYDLILMSRDTFSGLDFNGQTKKQIVDTLTEKYFDSQGELNKKQKQKLESLKQFFAKEVEKIKSSYTGIEFEDLGVDLLVRDESHDVKNLIDSLSFQEVKGLSGAQSSRALHHYIASNIVRANNDGRNVIMLTATPISNTPLEIFNMMLPFAEEDLAKMGIKSIDDFIRRFAKIDTEPSTDADGSLVEQKKFVGWTAGDTIRQLFYRFVDYKTHKDVKGQNIKFPKEKPIHEYTELNPGQKQIIDHCRLRLWANRVLSQKKMREVWEKPDEYNGDIETLYKDGSNNDDGDPIQNALDVGALTPADMEEIKAYSETYLEKFLEMNAGKGDDDKLNYDGFFKVQSDMTKATADLEWYHTNSSEYSQGIDQKFVDKHTSYDKLNKLTGLVSDEYKNGGKQVIFAINIKLHEKIKDELIKAGVKPEEIIIVNGNTVKKSSDRLQVSNDFNSGKYKVVIGNYATMGEGLNFNNGTTKGYHLQPPWNSLQYEQGNGRFIRQGNKNESVDVHYFLSRGSVDAFMNQKVMDKKDMVEKFLKGETDTWEDDISLDADDMLIELARNPEEASRLLELKRKNQEKANTEFQAKANIRKLARYHNNLKDMRKIQDKTAGLYSRLQKENEAIENEFTSEGHEYSNHLDKNRKYFIDEKNGVVLPENVMLSAKGINMLVKSIDNVNKTCQVFSLDTGETTEQPLSNVTGSIKKSNAEINYSPGDVIFHSIVNPSENYFHAIKVANILEPDTIAEDQLQIVKRTLLQKLQKEEPYTQARAFVYNPDTNKLVYHDTTAKILKERNYDILLPCEKHFVDVLNNSESDIVDRYASFRENKDAIVKAKRLKYPTNHEPVTKLTEIEKLYQESKGLTDEQFVFHKKERASRGGMNASQKIRAVFNDVKRGDYQEYAELLAGKIEKQLIKYVASETRTNYGTYGSYEFIADPTDPNVVDQLNFLRAYRSSRGWSKSDNLFNRLDEMISAGKKYKNPGEPEEPKK